MKYIELPFKNGHYTDKQVIEAVAKNLSVDFVAAEEKIASREFMDGKDFLVSGILIGKMDGEICSFEQGKGNFPALHNRHNFKPGDMVAIFEPGMIRVNKKPKARDSLHQPSDLYKEIIKKLHPNE